jgi:uncharacterized surface protein with fasciclin (FAS1) repeats
MKILRNLNRMFLMMLLGTTIVASNSSCKDDDPAPAPQKNINEIVNTDTSFSLLKQAVTKAGLGTALSTGNLTVFAPDNAAFAASGINSASINALPVPVLAELLTYHVLGSKVVSTAVPVSDSVRALSGDLIFASRNANGVFVNGIKVKTADVAASNGVIHVISKVLFPVPSQTIAGIATATPNLSILLAAVSRAGLTGAVSGPGKYTVFAPTDSAFAAAGYPTVASINAAPVTAVAAIVKSHVLPTNVFSSDLIAGATQNTLQTGVNLTVGTTPASVKITGSANAASKITSANILATNGVVHIIDKVLL